VLGELRAEAAAEGGFAVCLFRAWREEPLVGLQEAARAELQAQAAGPLAAPAGSLAETLRAWSGQAGTLLLVFDQFEEYFQYHPGEQEGERLSGFAAELVRIVNDPGLAVNVLLSIREDAWASLDRFEGHIPSLFANYLRVDHLDLQAAREAIEGPIAAFNQTLPPGEALRDRAGVVEAVLSPRPPAAPSPSAARANRRPGRRRPGQAPFLLSPGTPLAPPPKQRTTSPSPGCRNSAGRGSSRTTCSSPAGTPRTRHAAGCFRRQPRQHQDRPHSHRPAD
jgi:hypothetical protein